MMKLFRQKLGSGPPLVILHGLFGSGDNWMTHAKFFADHFEVFLVDLRNHGHSPHHSEMNFQVMADDLFEFFADEGLRDVCLVGHSLGGKVSLRFAQQHSFLLSKLAVVDIGIRAYKPHHQHIFDAIGKLDLRVFKTRSEVEKIITPAIEDGATIQFLLKNLYWKDQGQLEWRFNLPVLEKNIANMTAALPSEPEIETETLFIRGANSNYIRDEDMKGIQTLVPHSEFVSIQGAGHWVHAESPEEFRAALSLFLNQ
jgi:esterase